MDEQDILVDEDGTIRYVYTDALDAVFAEEPRSTMRASHVEPYKGGWIADMGPSGGPWLFANGNGPDPTLWRGNDALIPFATRQAALDAERAWLRKEKGL